VGLSLGVAFFKKVFGRVTKGMDVVQAMEHAKCNHLDKPLDDIKILSIDISTA
jgi:peptidylprolyl isomerase domain and WD repeat-containing protein 1